MSTAGPDLKYAVFYNSPVYHAVKTPELTVCGKRIWSGYSLLAGRPEKLGRPGGWFTVG
jgi:hypothetical protein